MKLTNEGHLTTAPKIHPASLSTIMLAMLSKVLVTRYNYRSFLKVEVKPLTLPLLTDVDGFFSELSSVPQNEVINGNFDNFARVRNDNELQNENDDFLEIAIGAEK